MGCEISDVAFIVQFEKPKRVVDFSGSIEDFARMVCESSQMYSILLARDKFCSLSLLDIEYVHCLIGRGSNKVLTLVIKVQRGDMGFDRLTFDNMGKLLTKRSIESVDNEVYILETDDMS
jgi:hypothetical protein